MYHQQGINTSFPFTYWTTPAPNNELRWTHPLLEGGGKGRCGGSIGKVWWLNGSTSDCSPAVPGSNPVPPQPTADCQSSGGLPPGMALGWGLTSTRGDRGENYEKCQKHIKKKKTSATWRRDSDFKLTNTPEVELTCSWGKSLRYFTSQQEDRTGDCSVSFLYEDFRWTLKKILCQPPPWFPCHFIYTIM